MKGTQVISRLWIVLLCAGLWACSAEVTTNEDDVQAPQSSPKTQALKVTSESETEAGYNEIYMSKPSTSAVTYYFEYKPKGDLELAWEGGTRAGIECDLSKVTMESRWLEIDKDERVISDETWEPTTENFRVSEGKNYRLALTFRGLKGCQYLSLNYVIRSYEVEELFLGERNLTLAQDVSIYPHQRGASMYYDLKYSSEFDQRLYFSYVSEAKSPSCENVFRRQMQWLTLNERGKVIDSRDVSDFSEFDVVAGAKHKLRVWFKNAEGCDTLGLSFSVYRL